MDRCTGHVPPDRRAGRPWRLRREMAGNLRDHSRRCRKARRDSASVSERPAARTAHRFPRRRCRSGHISSGSRAANAGPPHVLGRATAGQDVEAHAPARVQRAAAGSQRLRLMASVVPESGKIKAFPTEAAFESWMRKHHAREREVWLRIYKKGSAVRSITIAEALDVVLCWGWIDGIRKAFDERSYLQRYTPRRAKSIWSQINRGHVVRLTKAGRMTPHGQRQVDAAKADGRWNRAY